ncbi:MAG: hypothetical protein U1G05_14970 [Kiritimatiellia bacterium]
MSWWANLLGKAPGLDPDTRHGWEHIADLLEGRRPGVVQGELGNPMPPAPPPPRWAEVDVGGLRVEWVRDFGEGYLALTLGGGSGCTPCWAGSSKRAARPCRGRRSPAS